LTKADIRLLSKKFNISTWDKPSLACLSSRIPYGMSINEKILKMIGSAEEVVKNMGFSQVRVRHHGNIARIEVPL
jgi:uncharacterized protein